MARSDALASESTHPSSDSGVRLRRTMHPLLATIENAPLVPISDEENAQLDEIVRTTTHWLSDEEFVESVGTHLE